MESPIEVEEIVSELQGIAQNVRQIGEADWKDQQNITDYTLGRINTLCQKLAMPVIPPDGSVSVSNPRIVIVDASVASQMSRALDLALGEA